MTTANISAIDTRLIVDVTFELIPVAGSSVDYPSMVFTRNTTVPLRENGLGVIVFYDMDDVARYFGGDSEEYQFARVFFTVDNSSTARPDRITFLAWPDAARAPWIRGTTSPALMTDIRAIGSGEFSLNINGTAHSITAIDLSSASTYSEVATLLQTAIRVTDPDVPAFGQLTVTYNPYMRVFELVAGGTGADGQVITAIDGNLATALGVASTQNPITSYGSDAQTPGNIMAIVDAAATHYSAFTSLWEATADEVAFFAQYQAGSRLRHIYYPWNADTSGYIRDPDSTDGVDYLLASMQSDSLLGLGNIQDAVFDGYGYTTGSIISAFPMGLFSAINTTIPDIFAIPTPHGKSQAGMPYMVNDTKTAQTLFNKKVSFYGNYALDQARFRFYAEGATMGPWAYADHVVAANLLGRHLANGGMQLITTSRKIPPNRTGDEMIYAQGFQTGTWGQNLGICVPGITLDAIQQAKAISQSGNQDIVNQLYAKGFFIDVPPITPAMRAARRKSDNRFWWVYGGSVHFLDWQVKAFN